MYEIPKEKRVLSKTEVSGLNQKYHFLSIEDRIAELYKDFDAHEVMLTSSFAANSALLLKLFSDIHHGQKVHFIDTGFHFKETMDYKKELSERFHLNVECVRASKEDHDFTTHDETWRKDPDFCCFVNKVQPLNQLKEKYTVWVSGLMRWQSDHRSTLDIFETRGGILKFYPLLDISKAERDRYLKEHQLPAHPLVHKGYSSIGCTHCTVPGEDRDGRWNDLPKTECGLHL